MGTSVVSPVFPEQPYNTSESSQLREHREATHASQIFDNSQPQAKLDRNES